MTRSFLKATVLSLLICNVVSVEAIWADEINILNLPRHPPEEVEKGDLERALESQKSVRKALRERHPVAPQELIDNCEIKIAELEQILAMPPDTLEEISHAYRKAANLRRPRMGENPERYLAAFGEAHDLFSRHLPWHSFIRICVALEYSRAGRHYLDPAESRELISKYHEASTEHYGLDHEYTVGLTLELGIIDLLIGEDEQAYDRMQQYLFPVNQEVIHSHIAPRLAYAPLFLEVLASTGQYERVGENARLAMTLYSPHIQDPDSQGDYLRGFITSAYISLDAFERCENWLSASELCRFVLLHDVRQEGLYLKHKLHFLKGRYKSLVLQGEHIAAATVAEEISEAELEIPRLCEWVLDFAFGPLEAATKRIWCGDFGRSLELIKECRDELSNGDLVGHEPLIERLEVEIADLEGILALAPDVLDELSTALDRAADSLGELDNDPTSNPWADVSEARECLARHLPTTSLIRMRVALIYSIYSQRNGREGEMREAIQEYLDVAVREYGPECEISVRLNMELAMIDLTGDNPEEAFRRLRGLLLADDPHRRIHNYLPQAANANDALQALHRGKHFEWFDEIAMELVRRNSPRAATPQRLAEFHVTGESVAAMYFQREEWQKVAEVCRFMLEHEDIEAPAFLQTRIKLLDALRISLLYLEEHDEVLQVSVKLTEARYQDPARRSRYSED